MSVFSLLQPLKMLITSTLQPDQPLLTVNSAGDSFVAVSWTLKPGWETALEGITPKVVSTNLNYTEGFDLGRNFWITVTPVKPTISLEMAAPTRAISLAESKSPVEAATARAHADQTAAQPKKTIQDTGWADTVPDTGPQWDHQVSLTDRSRWDHMIV